MRRENLLVVVLVVFAVGCQRTVKPVQTPAAPPQAVEVQAVPMQAEDGFKLKPLPDKAEWEVKLSQPLAVAKQRIFHAAMPEAVYTEFPVEEYQDRQPGTAYPMVIEEQQERFGYRMTMELGKKLLDANGVKHEGGIGYSGNGYCYFKEPLKNYFSA